MGFGLACMTGQHGTRLRLRLPSGSSAEWGDRVTAFVRVERPHAQSNPGGFEPRAAADAAGLAATGAARFAEVIPGCGVHGWPGATM